MTPENKIGCSPSPCKTCPYRCDVPSGIWAAEEYAKLPAYDAETFGQPPALFMCHTSQGGLCTGWLQSHANRDHRFDLLALRFARNIDHKAVSAVCLMEPLVKLFKTGAAAARHGMKAIANPSQKAKSAMAQITSKRARLA